MPTMKAVRIHAFGGPEVLVYEDAPRPEPAPGEVLVRVHAAGLNPIDWKTRQGGGVASRFQAGFPLILGWDISGVVESTGAGVREFAAGDAVYGMPRFPDPVSAYAEYVTVPAATLARKPATLDHTQAAALPLAALTAWQVLFEAAELTAGQTLLVHAAAGGVGHLAVQLAHWKRARVIGTASGRNAAFLRKLGVDQVVDYTTTRFEAVVKDVDVVLDSLAGDIQTRSLNVVGKGGVVVSILGMPAAEAAEALGVRLTRVFVRPDAAQLIELARLVDSGSLQPEVSAVFPLAEAAQAHALLQSGHVRGKIVLDLADSITAAPRTGPEQRSVGPLPLRHRPSQ